MIGGRYGFHSDFVKIDAKYDRSQYVWENIEI